MADRGREAARLGRTLVNEPRAFPRELGRLLKRSIRTVWDARGGGYYACGVVVTFVILEIRLFADEIAGAEGVGDFLTEQAVEMYFRYFSESFVNGFLALIWPAFVLQFRPPWGIALLVGGYLLFAHVLKAPLERWLFSEEPTSPRDEATMQ